jgi:hypothetical protein
VNRLDNLELKWEVLSAVNAPNRHPQITLKAALTK